MAPKHPYYPLNAKIVGYHPMVLEMSYILAVFGGSMALVAILTWFLSGAYAEIAILLRSCCDSLPSLSISLKLIIPFLILCQANISV